jgi:AraC-like DNA-binding protein
MDTRYLYNFIDDAKEDSFFSIVIEEKIGFSKKRERSGLEERLKVCRNFLEASYVNYHIFGELDQIICFINYDSSSFSVRAFVGQFKQVLYNLDPADHICVFYSEGFTGAEPLILETLFILENTDYGLVLGKNRAIPSSYLHLCEESRQVPSFPKPDRLAELLRSRNFDEYKGALASAEYHYTAAYNEENALNISIHNDILSRIRSSVTLFFLENSFSTDITSMLLPDLLVRYNGGLGFIREVARALDEYVSDFTPTPVSKKKQQHIEDMLEFINGNISTVSLSSLSGHFGLTGEYISRLFKEQYDMNFTDYIKKKRFELATGMLRSNPDLSVTELCRQLGYQSRSYFQNIFKKEYGITPDAYKKQYHKRTSD